MNKNAPVLIAALLLGLGAQAPAEMCTLDVVPAATLLLPYFEVDVDNPLGKNTIFSINNALPDPALGHLIIWSDWAAPIIDFDIFLTGYDVVTVDMRDMIVSGNIPITADEQSDPTDTISPHGEPAWDGSFTGCEYFFPWFVNPVIQGSAYDRLHNGTQGHPVTTLSGLCLGEDHGDNVARGYVTVDNVNGCSLYLDPGDIGYFVDGGLGIANNINQLWGDYFIIDSANGSITAEALVHVEADDTFNANSTPTNATFYGRYIGASGRDNREPLGTVWGVRYLNAGAFSTSTEFIVWRDTTAYNILPGGETCGTGPDWKPLDETEVLCFDDEETPFEMCVYPDDPHCFPLAAQRVATGVGPLSFPFDHGWCHLNLNFSDDAVTGDVDFPIVPPGTIAQSHVSVVYSVPGLHAGGLQAVELAQACATSSPRVSAIFVDGFEAGDTGIWSGAVP